MISIHYIKSGKHYHCRVYVAPKPGAMPSLCGTLVFTEGEMAMAQIELHAEWIDDALEAA